MDRQSKWFGVARDRFGKPVLEDYGRYDVLSAESMSRSGRDQLRFPQLVSFIGVTNSGKSAVINLLISLIEGQCTPGGFPAPVVGAIANESVPTTDGVSMYSDPATSEGSHPIRYIDCEGFEGGEKAPLGSQVRRHDPAPGDHGYQAEDSVRIRSIKWATTEESRRREYAVTTLYPRILYTFSDCVVFVLRNSKTFQSSVLTKLIGWGAAALERSINQPTLPHCIVTLNCSDAAIDASQWDSDCATRTLLSTVRGAINFTEGVPTFRALADHWRKLGRNIVSIEDLILCYYSSFRVVRLPTGSQFNRMQEQISQLRQSIRQCCHKSSEAKKRTRMQTDAIELGTYLQSGFDHFTTHLDLPFDFMQVSLAQNPIPHNFGDHILQLCLAIQRLCLGEQDRTRRLLERMGTFVGSCVLLDCARYRKGRLETLSIPYEKFFERAVGEYLALHVRCAYSSPGGTRHCNMVQARHDVKGHQDQRGVIASGDFVPPFGIAFASQWARQHKEAMSQLEIDFCYRRESTSPTMSDRHIAWDLHLESVDDFYGNMGASATMIRSHTTCLCCLKETPQFALPCGHVLCDQCTRACGRRSELSLMVDCCPLHHTDSRWEKPAILGLKPSEAGACALSLDGGGIRGIVQLETLRAIEHALGNHVPVQKFFDLIVGTGTGGLIAVSLVAGGRSIDQCLDLFLATCDHAYATDSGSKSLVERVSRLAIDKRKSRTLGLHRALRDAFTSHRGFFGEVDQFSPNIKVALTSTSDIDGHTVLLANYRRPESDDDLGYSVLTTTDPGVGPRTWQAVGATMTDAFSFKPVKIGDRKFLSKEGRDDSPCDVVSKEVRCIWPAAHSSMVCLSLGTGQDWKRISASLLAESVRCSAGTPPSTPATTPTWPRSRFFARRRAISQDKVLDAERSWQRFKTTTSKLQPHAKGHGLLRLNPDLGVDREPPRENDYASLRRLQASVRDTLNRPSEREVVKRTANRLVAASFYFQTDEVVAFEKDTHVISGRIACQFEEDIDMIRGLGRTLRDQFREPFEPYFEIRPVADSSHVSSRVSLTIDRVLKMIEHGIFERPVTRVCLDRSSAKPSSIQLFFAPSTGHLAHGYPLGGLPRILINRHSSVVQSYAAQRPASPASHMLKRTSSKGSILDSTSFERLSRQSSCLNGRDQPRPNNMHAFPLAHWSSPGNAPPHSSTRRSNLDRVDPDGLSTPNNHAQVVQEDFALFPRGLAVQRSSRVFDGERFFNREHSVLLPPPVTIFERPLMHDSRVNPHYGGYTKTSNLYPSHVAYTSPNSSGTTASPSDTDRDASTWTSFSNGEGDSSPGSGESKVCMHLSSSKA
jgi:predicted acylesterase/phospholipase RssA